MRREKTAIVVKIQRPLGDIPLRSRLYGLEPYGIGTLWTESLTSYLNRLGWRHGVSLHTLVAQEMLPHLSHEHLPLQLKSFYRQAALKLNGNGDLALEWLTLLERLTGRADLHSLTSRWGLIWTEIHPHS